MSNFSEKIKFEIIVCPFCKKENKMNIIPKVERLPRIKLR